MTGTVSIKQKTLHMCRLVWIFAMWLWVGPIIVLTWNHVLTTVGLQWRLLILPWQNFCYDILEVLKWLTTDIFPFGFWVLATNLRERSLQNMVRTEFSWNNAKSYGLHLQNSVKNVNFRFSLARTGPYFLREIRKYYLLLEPKTWLAWCLSLAGPTVAQLPA